MRRQVAQGVVSELLCGVPEALAGVQRGEEGDAIHCGERCEGPWICGRGVRWSVRCCPIATTDRLTAGADVVEHDIYGGGWKNDDLRFVRQLALEDLQTATKSAR